ncbi:NADH-quinone oxidoreductase subunit 5 family protein [Streptomyces sp. WMMC1477]|uniref:NADH-quinone oxidoreductase subunit 5 family protein n=1 Tax=Streptomyces sp. WMMC1477 TaxID=3015155 RepID=UPI0022B622B6|nr:NADH-quinone oxidoreductase subunit L [Streptomyces sp. WMMC1477]MCZ7432876.1 NADH-quinone oxidoreductase subunit L [Streptomyces sp. WMMC1477]
MSTTALAVLVPVLPFLGALGGLGAGRRAPGFVRPLAVLPTLTAAVLAVVVAVRQGGRAPLTAATELTPTGNAALPVELAFNIDGTAVLVAVLVAVVASCVQIYSTGYLRDDPRYASYSALVSLFTAAMLLVVYSDDLIVLLVGWEVMGICSYFLVGHYWETAAARAASLKAFLVTKLGDVPFLIGILALASDAGTFRISTIVTRLTSPLADFQLDHPTVIALLLLAGVAGKSAQFPLHTWLPDAMAGPTPVSALIHAATMVAAGVYFVARLLPVFTASAAALVVLALLAAVTMAGSALAALAQDDVKRVLAYSTIGQLGYLAGALAVADRGAAVFHLLSHGAFKALLFLSAGVLIHAAGTGSLTAMARAGGTARRVPDVYWTLTIGLLALAAIPPFSGFFSKEAVLGAAEHAALDPVDGIPAAAGWIVLVAGLLTAALTAAYAARLWLLACRSEGAAAFTAAAPAAGAVSGGGAHVVTGAGTPADGGTPDVEDAAAPEPGATEARAWAATEEAAEGAAAVEGAAAEGAPAEGAVAGQGTGAEPRQPEPGHTHPPFVMTAVLWALALPSLAFGLFYGWLPHWLGGGSLGPTLVTSVLATGAAALGAALAWGAWRHAVTYGAVDPGAVLLGPLHRAAVDGFHLDVLYQKAFVTPVRAAATLVRFLDREVIDAYVRGAGTTANWLGRAVRLAQTGNVQTYLSALLAGSIVLALAVVLAGA